MTAALVEGNGGSQTTAIRIRCNSFDTMLKLKKLRDI